jgi:hypothetical protein
MTLSWALGPDTSCLKDSYDVLRALFSFSPILFGVDRREPQTSTETQFNRRGCFPCHCYIYGMDVSYIHVMFVT